MQAYRPRHIAFKELREVNDWKVKVYTISKTGQFDHPVFYQNVINQLEGWLSMENGFNASHENTAFLILHAGSEGIFSLINWWVGENMLNTHIFLTDPNEPHTFKKISGDGLSPCIWELEVINYERVAWTKHVLKQHASPDFHTYLSDVVSGEF